MGELAKMKDAGAVVAAVDPMVSMIERIAMDPGSDLDKLDRMLQMKERIDAQNSKIAFANALAEARAEIPPIIKDATVSFNNTNYRHETLAGIAKQIDPILSKFGLSYRFRTNQQDRLVTVSCIIAHRSGYSEETALSGAPDTSGSKNGFQAIGSAVTYLQRYTLKAALGLSAEVDDDAQSAGEIVNAKKNNDTPKFSPDGAAQRIALALGKATTIDALADMWKAEQDTIKKIKDSAPKIFAELAAAKDSVKASIEASVNKPDLADEIPY